MVAGRPHITSITRFDVSQMRTQFAAQIDDFDLAEHIDPRTVRRLGDYISMALYVANQAIADAGLDAEEDPRRTGVIVGSAIGGITSLIDHYDILKAEGVRRVSPFAVPSMLIDSAPGQIAIEHGYRGVNFGVVGACASGNYGIGEAYYAVRRGDVDTVICGGVETAIHPFTLAGFKRARAMSARNDCA